MCLHLLMNIIRRSAGYLTEGHPACSPNQRSAMRQDMSRTFMYRTMLNRSYGRRYNIVTPGVAAPGGIFAARFRLLIIRIT